MDNFNRKIFSIDTSVARPNGFQLFRGETMDVVCNLNNYSNPVNLDGATASAYWRSKDMASGNSWYTGPVEVSGSSAIWHWTDENDSGENMYDWFIRISDSDDSSYRAFGVLEMLGSPAGNPSAVPIPTTVLNFDDYTLMGTIPPENLAERYLRNSSPLGNEVDYVIDSTFYGSSYFDELYDLVFTDTEGHTHTITIDAINEYDWRNAANVLEAQGRTNYNFGGFNTFFVNFYIDGSDEVSTVEGVNAFFQRSGNLYTLTAIKGQDFVLKLYLQRVGTDGFSIYQVELKSANPSDLGFAINGTQALGALNGALYTDEKLWSGNLITESELALQLADVEVKDGSITTAKLADGAVTSAKLADFSVTSNKIATGSVTPSKLDQAYLVNHGASDATTPGPATTDENSYVADRLRNNYFGHSEPNNTLQFNLTANNGHSFSFEITSWDFADVVTMVNAADDDLVSNLPTIDYEWEMTVVDEDTGDDVSSYPILDWKFNWNGGDHIYAHGTGYFDGETPMQAFLYFYKSGNYVVLDHLYFTIGDATHQILGTTVDNDVESLNARFDTTVPASIGRLISEINLKADAPKQKQADWNQSSTTALDYIKNKPTVIPTEMTYANSYQYTSGVQQVTMANSDESKFAYLYVPQSSGLTWPGMVVTNGYLVGDKLMKHTTPLQDGNALTIPAAATSGDAVARTSDLPSSETWTFVLSDNTTVTKNVCIYN